VWLVIQGLALGFVFIEELMHTGWLYI